MAENLQRHMIRTGQGNVGAVYATYVPNPIYFAVKQRNYDLAERLILASTDPNSLDANTFALAVEGRNLRLAKLLLDKGANPNNRPFELIVHLYSRLVKIAHINQIPGVEPDPDEEYLEAIGLNGETDLDLAAITQHTSQLVKLCLENGADVNASILGGSAFHKLFSCDLFDRNLIEMMVNLGAHVNLTDSHGNTPFMSLVAESFHPEKQYKHLRSIGKRVNIDAQNCCKETALFRAMFHGRVECALLLIKENANQNLQASVWENDQHPGKYWRRHLSDIENNLRDPLELLTPLLAAYLYDAVPDADDYTASVFSVEKFNRVTRRYVAPVVDAGGFVNCDANMIEEAVRCNTAFGHLADFGSYRADALVETMFGNLSAGIGTLALRQWVEKLVFGRKGDFIRKMRKLANKPVPPSPKSSSCIKIIPAADVKHREAIRPPVTITLVRKPTEQPHEISEAVHQRSPAEARACIIVPSYGVEMSNSQSKTPNLEPKIPDDAASISPANESKNSLCADGERSWFSRDEWPLSDPEWIDPWNEFDSSEELEASLDSDTMNMNRKKMKMSKSDNDDNLTDEDVVLMLNPNAVKAWADDVGLPAGLRPALELEIARLQIGVVVFHHMALECNCADEEPSDRDFFSGDDEESDDNGSWSNSSYRDDYDNSERYVTERVADGFHRSTSSESSDTSSIERFVDMMEDMGMLF